MPVPSTKELPSFPAASLAAGALVWAGMFSNVDVLRMASSTGLLTDSAVAAAGAAGGGGGGKVGSGWAGTGVALAGTACFAGLFNASFSTPHKSVSALGSAVVTAALAG